MLSATKCREPLLPTMRRRQPKHVLDDKGSEENPMINDVSHKWQHELSRAMSREPITAFMCREGDKVLPPAMCREPQNVWPCVAWATTPNHSCVTCVTTRVTHGDVPTTQIVVCGLRASNERWPTMPIDVRGLTHQHRSIRIVVCGLAPATNKRGIVVCGLLSQQRPMKPRDAKSFMA